MVVMWQYVKNVYSKKLQIRLWIILYFAKFEIKKWIWMIKIHSKTSEALRLTAFMLEDERQAV